MMGRTVLVVDDDADLREAVADLLEDAGYRVLTAEHGRAALNSLRGSDLPDVILLDVMMPVMNGLEFACKMRTEPRLANLPIIIFTAHTDHGRAAEAAGAAASLKKPVNAQLLLETVEAVARRGPPRPECEW
jgi:two-component system, chemotaxis family, chemotaxis protein CheY